MNYEEISEQLTGSDAKNFVFVYDTGDESEMTLNCSIEFIYEAIAGLIIQLKRKGDPNIQENITNIYNAINDGGLDIFAEFGSLSVLDSGE